MSAFPKENQHNERKIILMKNLIISERIFLKSLLILKGLFYEVKSVKEGILKLKKITPDNTDNQ